MNKIISKAQQIRCLICDIDGVLTDGCLYIANDGNEMKAFNVQDGIGLKLLLANGIDVAVITASVNRVVDHRMKQLGIKHYYTGQWDKRQAYRTLQEKLDYRDEQFAYIGDDLPDLPLIQQAGLGVAVANAVDSVKEFSDWQTCRSGGKGAVRELCDLILKAQQKEQTAYANLLKQHQNS